jgi:hypothetical protein
MYIFLQEEALTTKERNALPNSAFGIPDTRSFPLVDATHVRNAIARFSTAPNKKKKELAHNILAAAKKFEIDVENKDILKYGK